MTTLADFNTKVLDRIKDTDAILTPAHRDNAVLAAVQTYNKHRPRTIVADMAGVTGTYDYALPSTFVTGFSSLQQVEYPAGEREPEILEPEDYTLYQSPTSTVLRFLAVTPESGKNARLTFTAPHTVSTTTSTIPATDEEAVANLAAAEACEWLSSHFSQQGDPTLTADSANQASRARDFALRAKAFRDLAHDHLGLPRTGRTSPGSGETGVAVPAASATREWDSNLSTGSDRLTHPRRWR